MDTEVTMDKLATIGVVLLIALKFIGLTLAWGILIAIGFWLGHKITASIDAKLAKRRVESEMKREGLF